jgi:hypothetical protein
MRVPRRTSSQPGRPDSAVAIIEYTQKERRERERRGEREKERRGGSE